jgi:hypothetical protein
MVIGCIRSIHPEFGYDIVSPETIVPWNAGGRHGTFEPLRAGYELLATRNFTG